MLLLEIVAVLFLWWLDASGIYEISLLWILAPLWIPWLLAYVFASVVVFLTGSKSSKRRKSLLRR